MSLRVISLQNMNISLSAADQDQLKELGVQALYIFGSRAIDQETPRSDFDFAILMPKAYHQRGDALHDKLYDILSPYCERTLQNDVIDIVYLRNISLELRMHVIRHGRVLYDNDPRARAEFEERTVLQYADYRPLLDIFDRAILQRYASH